MLISNSGDLKENKATNLSTPQPTELTCASPEKKESSIKYPEGIGSQAKTSNCIESGEFLELCEELITCLPENVAEPFKKIIKGLFPYAQREGKEGIEEGTLKTCEKEQAGEVFFSESGILRNHSIKAIELIRAADQAFEDLECATEIDLLSADGLSVEPRMVFNQSIKSMDKLSSVYILLERWLWYHLQGMSKEQKNAVLNTYQSEKEGKKNEKLASYIMSLFSRDRLVDGQGDQARRHLFGKGPSNSYASISPTHRRMLVKAALKTEPADLELRNDGSQKRLREPYAIGVLVEDVEAARGRLGLRLETVKRPRAADRTKTKSTTETSPPTSVSSSNTSQSFFWDSPNSIMNINGLRL